MCILFILKGLIAVVMRTTMNYVARNQRPETISITWQLSGSQF